MNAECNALPNNCCVDNKQSHNVATLVITALLKPLKRIAAYLAMHRSRRLDRLALRELSTMDDKTLKDIGISRGDIQWASNLPLSTSATTELEIVARRQQIIHRR